MAVQSGASDSTTAGVFGRAATTFGVLGNFAYFGERLVAHAQVDEADTVLDVATGRGAIAFSAAKRVGARGKVIGVDISPEMLQETAKELANGQWPMIELHQMDAEHLKFLDSTFDCVLCGFALWFFPNPEQGLKEFVRVLKPGKRVALTTVARDSPWQKLARETFRPFRREALDGGPVSRFDTIDELEGALKRAGLIDVRIVQEDFNAVVEKGHEGVWEFLWSGGFRRAVENLSERELQAAKARLFERLEPLTQSDGVHLVFRALITVATKPS
jgi:ubiquinone/menaquinone biosynthesis C-methylase UbiE